MVFVVESVIRVKPRKTAERNASERCEEGRQNVLQERGYICGEVLMGIQSMLAIQLLRWAFEGCFLEKSRNVTWGGLGSGRLEQEDERDTVVKNHC